MIDLHGLASADPLGIGGLLSDAYVLDQVAHATDRALVSTLLAASRASTAAVRAPTSANAWRSAGRR